MPNEHVITVTDANFDQEVARATVPVLVDFWAEWCGPCRMLSPVIEEIAAEKAGRVKVGKVNVDENPGLSSRFGIRAIPTMLVFKGGEVQQQVVGMTSKQDLIAKLEAVK